MIEKPGIPASAYRAAEIPNHPSNGPIEVVASPGAADVQAEIEIQYARQVGVALRERATQPAQPHRVSVTRVVMLPCPKDAICVPIVDPASLDAGSSGSHASPDQVHALASR
jgi:hypothetical protein